MRSGEKSYEELLIDGQGGITRHPDIGLVTVLHRSPERFKLATGERRDQKSFKQEAVRIALTSGLLRERVAMDLGNGKSTLGKWIA